MSAKPLNDLKAAAKAKSEGGKSEGGAPARDYAQTLFLPKTDFPMKAGLPELEPRLLARWAKLGLYKRLRKAAKGREKFTLHDGPPYANGNIHIGHALNKILKDTVVRSQQMMGRDANYVPGWDCHGLPIEWKIEEKYRAAQKNKDDVPVVEFRRECRGFAEHWKSVQCEDFKRLGVEGDWENPYTTMSYDAEATIAGELMKFAMNGSLYRGSKPVMWSVVERTALAEAEVEYHEHTSPTVFVKFPVVGIQDGDHLMPVSDHPRLQNTYVVIWTTTPWTLPGNRAVAYSPKFDTFYMQFEVTKAPDGNWAKTGDRFLVASKLADTLKKAAKIEEWQAVELGGSVIDPKFLGKLVCRHPLHESGYDFPVRLYEGDFVTDDTGTGFVHIAPGHGADDYGLFIDNKRQFATDGIEDVPHTVQPDGHYFPHVPLFGGDAPKRVVDDNGSFGKLDDMAYANAAVVQALKDAGALLAMGRLRHQYPHSWRSKAPVIFRNTPQWFIALDKPVKVKGVKKDRTIRDLALAAIGDTKFYPEAGRNRITGMIENRPDWVVSRQRAWGVPITVFVYKETGEIIPNAKFAAAADLTKRITDAFAAEGADAWFADSATERFLTGLVENPADWEQVTDILDVWFDSGSTHAFVLEKRKDLAWPASLYLEGSDQHRGCFHSSLLEACGTRGRAPYNAVLTHGFILDEKGEEKMSKSKGNALSPQKVMETSGAEILRLWVASSDFENDIRFGQGILQATTDSYRKLRNTLRFLLGALAHYEADLRVEHADMPELERWVLHRLAELDGHVRKAYAEFDFRRVFTVLFNFCTTDLSAVYLDIRKDAMYCEPYSSAKRRACLTVLDETFARLTAWLAPILCFTAEEAWLTRYPNEKGSVHLRTFPDTPEGWRDEALAARWEQIWATRSVITGALEVERREKRIGSSLEAAPVIYVEDKKLAGLAKTVDWAEIAITSAATLKTSKAPADAFRLDGVRGVAVAPKLAQGRKCARSWRITKDVGADPEFPDITPRDAQAVREWDAHHGAKA
ncbi:MAG: isoleucine--tRNA ligase [Hyphomicrobiales bacterium]|nr:isoleucine--tRNA ligase [Hyphomicrobiales bacterium]